MKQKMYYMDFCKGVAILMVILTHFVARLHDLNPLIGWIGLYGQMGCQLFFVISAYFATAGLDRKREKFGNFMSRKLKRLMPCYIAAILIHLPIIVFLRDYLEVELNYPSTSVQNVIGNIFFAQHYLPSFSVLVTGSWFIWCLILFYAVFWFILERGWLTEKNIWIWMMLSLAGEIV